MATPFITPIKNQGGTFYTFPSANEDYNFNASSPNKEFKFSKFVLLDLPPIQDPSSGKNTTGIENIPSSYLKVDTDDYNQAFAESFQNYCLNFETLLVSQDGYDSSQSKTVSEKVFWKWMKEMGAMRFREAEIGNPEDGGERTRRTEDNLSIDNIINRSEIGKRFVEENPRTVAGDGLYPYERVVKYIGNIDATNGVKYQGTSFLEIYALIPTDVGHTPTVLFKSDINDSNYTKDMRLEYKPNNALDNETIVGRSYNDSHPVSLDIRAHYDSDNDVFSGGSSGIDSYDLKIKKPGESTYSAGWWYTNAQENSYFTEPTKLNDYRNDWMKIEGYRNSEANDREFLRSRLDGITIDFNLAQSYSDNLSGKYQSWEDYNRSDLSEDFGFNAMLIYYDLVDKADPSKTTTNLFGVYFLDKWKDGITTGAEIEKFKKFKPDVISKQNGNSYAWKINLKHDLNAQDSVQVNVVNEYNNFSMHLYMEALELMKKSHNLLIDNISGVKLLQDKVDALEDIVADSTTLAEVETKLATLENSLATGNNLFTSSDEIIDLINRNYSEVLNIYKNYTSIEMAYNLDVIAASRGILLDRSIPGKVKVKTKNNGYSLSKKPIVSFTDMSFVNNDREYRYNHSLQEANNYIRIIGETSDDTLILDDSESIAIYVNDKDIRWENGQSLKVSFGSKYDLVRTLPKAFKIFTDSQNRTKSDTGSYSVELYSMSGEEFANSDGKPVVEIICVDYLKYEFVVDLIR